jgi:hypothetical protein
MMHSADATVCGAAISSVAEKCPHRPHSTGAYTPQHVTPSIANAVFAGLVRHPAVAPQTDANYRISYDRSRQKRGPPSLILS